jgi:hypothetical protein
VVRWYKNILHIVTTASKSHQYFARDREGVNWHIDEGDTFALHCIALGRGIIGEEESPKRLDDDDGDAEKDEEN